MLKPQISTFQADAVVELGTVQAAISLNMAAKESSIVRLLSISGDANVSTCECISEQCLLSGRANFRALCVDDTNNIISMNYNADFSDKFSDKRIAADSKLMFDCKIIDIDTTVEGQSVKATAVVEITMHKIETRMQSYLTVSDGLSAKTNRITVGQVKEVIDGCFNITHEHEVKHPIARVLSAQGDAIVTSCKASNNVLALDGDLILAVTYLNANDMEIETVNIEVPFREEIETKHNIDDANLNLLAKVKNVKIACEVSDDSDNNTFTAEVQVCVKATAIARCEVETVADAFAMENELQLTHQSVESNLNDSLSVSAAKVNGNVNIPSSGMEIHRIIDCVNNKVMLLNCVCKDKQVSFEGIVQGVVLYKNDNNIHSFAFELPFATIVDLADAQPELKCNAQAVVTNINCRKDKGNTLEISVNMKFAANLHREIIESVVSGCTVGEQLVDVNYSPMQLFIVNKGDTLWDVCKQLHTTEEQLCKQNPNLVFPLSEKAKIVVYRPLRR